METLRSDTLHTSESVHSLPCINTHHTDELSKEKEEELLYGTGDDGDEEDALSDDSMRLRLSDDDEIETEDILTSVLNNQENELKTNKIETTSEDMEISPEKNVKNDTNIKKINPEEQCSDNDSMDEKIVIDYERIIKKGENENEVMKHQTINTPRLWPNYELHWRYPRSPNGRPFRSISHTYNRFRPRGRYRLQSYDFRQQKKSFKSNAMQRQNSPIKFDQNLESSLYKNVFSKTIDNDIKIIKIEEDHETINEDNTLYNESSININKNDSNQSLNKEVGDTITKDSKEENFVNSIDNSLELKHKLEENMKIIQCKDKNKDILIHASNDNSVVKLTNSTINSHDNNTDNIKLIENSINNADVDSNNFSVSNNSKIIESLNINVTYKHNEYKNIEHTKENNVSNQKQEEIVKITNINESGETKHINKLEKQNSNKNQELTYVNQDIKNNYRITDLNILNEKEMINESIINKEITNHKINEILTNKEEISLENMKSNKEIIKTTITVSNDLSNENDNEIKVIQNVTTEKSVNNSEKCDNQILKTNINSTNSIKINEFISSEDQVTQSKIDLLKQNENENDIKSIPKENSVISSTSITANLNENIKLILNENSLSNIKIQNDSLDFKEKDNSGDNDKIIAEPIITQKKKRRTKKMITIAQGTISEEDKQVKESGRQKRRTAKNAEEIIRKKFLNYDSDLESSDSSEKFVVVNYKMNQDACPLSPPSLKRTYSDTNSTILNGNIKKIKINSEACDELKTQENNSENIKKLNYVHKFFQRDLNEKLPKLKQEELEELLIQKIVETITMRDEIGKLREQARISEKNQEVMRAKCQQLAKQIKDFEMVLSRNAADRRANNDKSTPPIKINRSVGLQVNFMTDHGMQNLRQLQQNSNLKSLHLSSNNNNTSNTSINETNTASPRKGIKVRSPRRTESIIGQNPVVPQNHTQSPNIMTTITPAALVVAKPVDTQHSLTLPNQSNVQQIMSNQQMQSQQSQQTIVLNGKFSNQINRQGSTTTNVKSHTNDLIDLTDEEEKSKATGVPVVTTTITDQQVNLAQKTQQPCFQRVIQTIPGNVAITSQPPSIRVVQPASQPTPTALVNNMNAPRLTYVMQSGVGPTRQLLIAPNSSPIRPVTSCRASFSTLTYKTGISTIANGTVRVLTTPATSSVQLNKHPAPLPDIHNYAVNPLLKLPPPAPSLKISKVAHGIVLSWNMNLSEKYADIVSYQLYAYQEITGIPPNTSLWKKVGDVRALPLPMACTLTQFSEGNNYYFAVRAVDTHSRKGQYSLPGNISL
ncbi:Activating transcription factor 7-interacting protein [Apis cerana cerana]|uniref:Activating transcription factor 7-interacting protein n=1 Tax=Apis cerana cerana TaxID=94128 RepID=A0A2A3E1P4_APICC|nr:Activating transcription factor 7-interacting protein [Apis cerana cerana]